MSSSASAHDDVKRQWHHYRRELERAARAGETAANYEGQAARPPSTMQPFRERMAALHRRIEQRHYACARLYQLHALRLQRWRASNTPAVRPVFMAAVAEDLGVVGAAITLFDDRRQELLTASSDARSSAAHDIEATVGQGPSHDVVNGIDSVVVEAADLAARWPEYGRGAIDLGIGSVVAVPLTTGLGRLGTLCGFSEEPRLPEGTVLTAGRIADALANDVLLDEQLMSVDGIAADGGLFDDADYLTTVNQAVGMVAAQGPYSIDTALVLMRARAFADGMSLAELARRVLEEGYRLC
ncbi:ANTAR domain-containing protein [Nocardia sp. BMG51109]|uniref:ANTAR domain-containing protein n=1 Tax=Nocardia sp. BMG51109 TaxID=1056816 RepID=UPI0012EBC166|nr:ANTAR domain-containing protein [Nocardia sp. BMG51109]